MKSPKAEVFFKYLAFFLVFIFIIVLDQVSKAFATYGARFTICNTHFAFGIGFDSPALNISIIVITLLITVLAAFKVKNDLSRLALTFVLAGGVSNLVGRYLDDYCVVDIFHLPFWPNFNLADSAISIGVGLLLFSLFIKRKK